MNTQSTPKAISKNALEAYRSAKNVIIEDVVSQSLANKEQIQQHGAEADKLIRSGIQFTMDMLESAMTVGAVALLEDQLTWASDRLPHDNVAPEHVLARFRICRDCISKNLSDAYAAEIVPFIDWMIARQNELMKDDA